MSLKGRQTIGKLENNVDTLRENYLFATVSKISSGKVALDTVQKKFGQVVAGEVCEADSTDNILHKTGHGLKVGWMIRLITTANYIIEEEIHVDEIIDADHVKLSAFLSASLTAGDEYDVYKPVSERVGLDGSSLATVISPPIQYNRKAAGVTNPVTVLEDLDTPSASRPLPVALHSVDGANIIVNAGDLSVSINHTNDSVSIGDGTTLVGVTVANELKTHDADLLTELRLKADLTETQPVSLAIIPLPANAATETGVQEILTELKLKADLTETQPVSIAGTVTIAGALTDAQLRATPVPVSGSFFQATQPVSVASLPLPTGASTEAKQDAEAVLIGAVTETAPANDTASSGLNGRLQRIAQRITSLINLFPLALGQGTMAQSFKVVLPSDQVVATTVATNSTGAQTKSTLASGSATLTAPANATGFILKNAGDSDGDLCWEIGGTATSASFDLTAGQGTALVPCGNNVSIFAKGGSVNYAIQWLIK